MRTTALAIAPGTRYGRWTVIREVEHACHSRRRFLCRCDCGSRSIVDLASLRHGRSQSCGCLRREVTTERATVHGWTSTRLYRIWCLMRERCRNPKNKRYAAYGGRGIRVCAEWSDSFEAFRDWALANDYRGDLQIDRVDNAGDYRPENCRWTTFEQQANNRRNNHLISLEGVTMTVQQWATATGIGQSTIRWRLTHGWSPAAALSTPVRTGHVTG